MKIAVHVRANARKDAVERIDGKTYRVSVTAPPVDGKANERVIVLLAAHFGTSKRNVAILRGANTRQKLVEIL